MEINTKKGNTTIIAVVIIVLILAGGFLFFRGSDDNMSLESADFSIQTVEGAGSYESYSPEKVALNGENGKVLLFFHASWCPTCRAHESNILGNLEKIPGDLTILKTNYDTEKELKEKYGIRIQHTFVQVDKDGNEIAKWIGGNSIEDILRELK